jgi:hypothetical protein
MWAGPLVICPLRRRAGISFTLRSCSGNLPSATWQPTTWKPDRRHQKAPSTPGHSLRSTLPPTRALLLAGRTVTTVPAEPEPAHSNASPKPERISLTSGPKRRLGRAFWRAVSKRRVGQMAHIAEYRAPDHGLRIHAISADRPNLCALTSAGWPQRSRRCRGRPLVRGRRDRHR